LRLLLPALLQRQFIGIALAPNLARNSLKQLIPEVPNGHCPSNTMSLGQNLISPVHHNITNTSESFNINNILRKQNSQIMVILIYHKFG